VVIVPDVGFDKRLAVVVPHKSDDNGNVHIIPSFHAVANHLKVRRRGFETDKHQSVEVLKLPPKLIGRVRRAFLVPVRSENDWGRKVEIGNGGIEEFPFEALGSLEHQLFLDVRIMTTVHSDNAVVSHFIHGWDMRLVDVCKESIGAVEKALVAVIGAFSSLWDAVKDVSSLEFRVS